MATAIATMASPAISCWGQPPCSYPSYLMSSAQLAPLAARKSFALRHNPGLIVGYMQQLREGSGRNDESAMTGEDDVNVLPPLVVMGEDEVQVEKQPHGYIFTKNLLESHQDGGLVTIDRVWQPDNMFLMPMPQQLKDICLSFALFKLLRCRFARYKLADVISMETNHFVRSVLLKDGQHERAFMMIADELSFLHDYYDSPLPVSYSANWLIIISMVVSLLSIGYYMLAGMDIIAMVYIDSHMKPSQLSPADNRNDMLFLLRCVYECSEHSDRTELEFGSIYSDLVPLLLLLLFVVVAEARDVASHLCSSWTKVNLTCCCVRRASLKLSPVKPKWVGWLLQCRCDWLMRHWNDKMRQSSLLVLHPRQFHQLVLPSCLLRLLGRHRSSNVKVPSEVKACIINALRSCTASNGAGLSKGTTSLRQSQAGRSLLWACDSSKGTSDTILVWHIATTILEARHPHHQHDHGPPRRPSPVSEKKTAATHLSRYGAYLVESCPELLHDDDAWSKDLYKKVKRDDK
ncbi:hypothetical protein D1007_17393 [Hordeum vulgare]|nr:hypothetical protein D1007_17393 [Hordeum vulgare]